MSWTYFGFSLTSYSFGSYTYSTFYSPSYGSSYYTTYLQLQPNGTYVATVYTSSLPTSAHFGHAPGGTTTPTSSGIVVDSSDNRVVGTAGADQLMGLDGADTLYGMAGDDIIYGNAGNDILYGDRDDFNGTGGTDFLYGGQGDDVIRGHQGSDVMYGNMGNDTFFAYSHRDTDDTVFGGKGDDRISASGTAYGELGNDTFTTGTREGSLSSYWGGPGQDVFWLGVNFNTYHVMDFNPDEDMIDLRTKVDGDELSRAQFRNDGSGNLVVYSTSWYGEESVVLVGVSSTRWAEIEII